MSVQELMNRRRKWVPMGETANISRLSHNRWVVHLGFLLIAAAYAGWVAETQPFTASANISVIVGYVLMGVVATRALVRRSREKRRAPGRADDRATTAEISSVESHRGAMILWIVSIGALLVLEIVTYVAGFSAGRNAFPTTSSLYDAAARWTAAKAAVVFAWMSLGWGLFSR
jgi:hypothetical protein